VNAVDSARIVLNYYSKNIDRMGEELANDPDEQSKNSIKPSPVKNEVEVSARLLKMRGETNKEVLNLIQ
jgi:hypothetical protein